ncbi:HRDC domain-containing protein [Prevotella sp.]|uniref:HRDC domain-containing protein n=1 Tax=Prevotella sp. TaxID=59823 RepID=UPI003076D5ED
MDINQQAQLAWDIIENTNTNIFLTGKAGTGKTTFLRRLKEESSKRIVVVAPTGIAAINAEGVTIHSFFQLSFAPFIPDAQYKLKEQQYRFSKQKIRVIQSIDTLVIDEISMVRADLLDAVDNVLRRFRKNNLPFGGVQMVMIGDLGQLAPVAKDDEWQMLSRYYDTPYFFSSLALKSTRYAIVELKTVYRQSDSHFVELLNRVRDNRADDSVLAALNSRYIPNFQPPVEEGYIRLTTHNFQAQQENDRQLALLPGKPYTYEASITGKYPEMLFPTEQTLTLKEGAQVMFVKNDSSADKAFYNGMLGTVTEINDKNLFVRTKDTGVVIKVEPEQWENTRYDINERTNEITEEVEGTFTQLPVKPAWAITVHKSQGLTFDRAIIDVQRAFTHGQTYVALSRCRTLEGLVLSAPLPMSAIIRDGAVDDYVSRAAEHTPTEGQIDLLRRDYYLSVISELFDFRPLMDAFNRMLDLLMGHFRRSYPKLIIEYKARLGIIKTQLYDVAERFKLQYNQIVISTASYQDDVHLQERLTKGAAYFARTISDIEMLVKNTDVKTDTPDVKKQVAELLTTLKELVMQKRALLNYVKDEGFSLNEYQHQRAVVFMGKDNAGTKKTAAKQKSPVKEKSAVKPKVEAAVPELKVLHPKVLDALTEWRRQRALKAHMPTYCILQQKAIIAIANLLPQDKEALARIPFCGNVKAEKYGDEILAVVKEAL